MKLQDSDRNVTGSQHTAKLGSICFSDSYSLQIGIRKVKEKTC